jgi:hypothetical protein
MESLLYALVPPERGDVANGDRGEGGLAQINVFGTTPAFPPRFASAYRSGGTNTADIYPLSILVKGSRFMKMERVVQHLEKKYVENSHAA